MSSQTDPVAMSKVYDVEMAPACTNKRNASQIEGDEGMVSKNNHEGMVSKDDHLSQLPEITGVAKRHAVNCEGTRENFEGLTQQEATRQMSSQTDPVGSSKPGGDRQATGTSSSISSNSSNNNTGLVDGSDCDNTPKERQWREESLPLESGRSEQLAIPLSSDSEGSAVIIGYNLGVLPGPEKNEGGGKNKPEKLNDSSEEKENKRKASQMEGDEVMAGKDKLVGMVMVIKDDHMSHVTEITGMAKRPAVDCEGTRENLEPKRTIWYRIKQMEDKLGMYVAAGQTTMGRIKALEMLLIGSTVAGSVQFRLTNLESELG